ncbi:MAG: class I SAM-dependent methyltransferase [Bacteroidota bacterium]
MDQQQYFDENQASWDAKVDIHKDSSFYDIEGFKQGKSSLIGPEVNELGGVAGKSMLHLQCHFGMDTLSWARRGAKAVGVDFSPKAIELAKSLNMEEEHTAQFILSSVYDLKQHLSGQFDIIFTSYGTIGWLPDLDKWAEIVAYFLKPGGTFYMIDFHPVVWMLDEANMSDLKYSYFNKGVITTEEKTYTENAESHKSFTEHGWNHPTSDLLTSLSNQNLRLKFYHEFDYSTYDCFANIVETGENQWQIKGKEGIVPMMYSLMMIKE